MISGPRPSNLVDRIQELDLNKEDRMTRAQRMIGPVAAALLLAVTAVTTQAQPQFAGTWTLDPAQSQFPAREGGHGHKAPDGRTLTIDTVMHTPRGDKTMRTVYLKS